MDIRQANTHLATDAGRGIAKMDGTGKLSNKIALVTGGTTGIGAAAARCFQAEGARVIVTGSNSATLQVARENMPGIEVIASDAGDVAATKTLIGNVKATCGRIDVLLVNAGISRFNPISMIDEPFFDALFGINVRGAYFVMKHAIEIMPDGGSVILTSSISGALGVAGQTVYGATKAAVRSFGRTFARELAPRSIRVNTSVPVRSRHPVLSRSECSPDKWRAWLSRSYRSREWPSRRGRLGGAVPSFLRRVIHHGCGTLELWTLPSHRTQRVHRIRVGFSKISKSS
jgi:NAD(P)-dependent dehydrogenase (short-subunit alcohol dehydrogenase family)